MYKVTFSTRAEKAMRKLTPQARARVEQKLAYLRMTPRGHDTKKLAGEENQYRTRVGDYRILYEIKDAELIVWVLDVGPRGGIYD